MMRRRIHAGNQPPEQPTRSQVYLLACHLHLMIRSCLYRCLAARAELGKFQASIGSTDASRVEYLIHDDSAIQTLTDDDMIESDSEDKDEDQALNNLYDRATKGEIDLDAIMISAAHAGKSKGVDPAHLSKIWKIDLKTVERTLNVVSQNNKRTDDPKLSRNYGAVPTTRCCDTGRSQSISSWIRSLPPRRLASHREVKPVASYSLLTRDLSTSFP